MPPLADRPIIPPTRTPELFLPTARLNGLEMGIRFTCPSGHKLHVKAFLAGKRGVCPHCGAKFVIPFPQEVAQSTAAGSQTRDSRQDGLAEVLTASTSIIIGVVDAPSAITAPADSHSSPEVSTDSAESTASTSTADPPTVAPPPTVDTAIEAAAESPAARHVSRRVRRRRKQVNTAIVLLAAVIVLTLVLIWVLQRGASQTSAGQMKPHRVANSWSSATMPLTRLS